jgi:hypothetical protein
MTLRYAAPGFFKPLGFLTLLAAMLVLSLASTGLLAPAAGELSSVQTAQSGPDGKLVTKTSALQNLPDRPVYDKVAIQVFGAVPPTQDGKTGLIEMFVLSIIFLSAVTPLMWRHYRRDNASPRRIGRRI